MDGVRSIQRCIHMYVYEWYGCGHIFFLVISVAKQTRARFHGGFEMVLSKVLDAR